jgi:uncharacterized protein YbjT (DUF2867 family)
MKAAVAGATGRVGQHVVEVLAERGHEVVPISRSNGVDVITGEGLAEALTGVEAIIDTATGPSPDQQAAEDFFTTATRNLQEAGTRAGANRLVVVSIIGADKFGGGYGAAKVTHEQKALAGPIPARILRAAQFHEFVEQLMEWGTRGDTAYLANMRTQLVAARSVAEALVDMTEDDDSEELAEIGGPREESLVEAARLLVASRGDALAVEAWRDPSDPYASLLESDALLPGPDAILAGPTFEQWLDVQASSNPTWRRIAIESE